MSSIFNMTQNSMNTPYAKRVAEKFKEAQNYLKTNGFSTSTKHLLEDIENTIEKWWLKQSDSKDIIIMYTIL